MQYVIGAKCVDEAGRELGVVADVMPAPAADVLVVKGDREILIPDVPAFVLQKDADNGVVTVRLIDGM